jgi:hypothetical protein
MNDVKRRKETYMRSSWKLHLLGFEGKGGTITKMITKKKNHYWCEDLGLLSAWKTHVYNRRKTFPPIIRTNQNTICCNWPTLQAFQDCKRIFLQIAKKTSKKVFLELLRKWTKAKNNKPYPPPMTSPVHNVIYHNKNKTAKNK